MPKRRKQRAITISWKLIFRLMALVSILFAGVIIFIAIKYPSAVQVVNVKGAASAVGSGVFFLLLAEFADDLF